MDYDDLKICNCSGCDRELAAKDQTNLLRAMRLLHKGFSLPALIAGRIAGRPLCAACLQVRRSKSLTKEGT